MRVLFMARRFPPSIGGMQQFAYDLSEALPSQDIQLIKVVWGGASRLTLPLVLPWLFIRGLWQLWTDRSIEIIHIQDAVMSPLGWLLSILARRPWVVVAHGLDLTFKLKFYQKVNVYFARKAAFMIAISEATAEEARARGIDPNRLIVIPLGVDNKPVPHLNAQKVRRVLNLSSSDQVLLTVGRLARRKGVTWFIRNVLVDLPPDVHYVVIGDGVERQTIEKAIQETGTNERVHLLGAVDDKIKQTWLLAADIFVMPNVKVPGDMEGFGIVAHEAALSELPVVASKLEGIAQALQNDKNGILLPPADAKAYRKTITKMLKSPKTATAFGKQARKYTIKKFGWPAIAKQYREVYEKLTSSETEAS